MGQCAVLSLASSRADVNVSKVFGIEHQKVAALHNPHTPMSTQILQKYAKNTGDGIIAGGSTNTIQVE
jgi:hypothetical protein